jgi:GT2 family glycosyltransferase
MKSDHKISIIMHTYYRYEYLEKVLKLLTEQTMKPFEIIISDQTQLDDRPPGFYENFKELPLKIINLDKPSHAPAQNIGARVSSGDILIFLDDDCEFSMDFVEQHINVMEDENVDVVVGPNSVAEELPDTDQNPDMSRRDPLSYFIKKVSFKWDGMVIYTTGGNMSVKRDFFFKIGGFDEKIPRMADVEIGLRLYQSGAKMYHSPKPFLHHFKSDKGGSRKAQRDIPYLRLVSYIYIYKKHFPGWSTHQFCLKEIWGALLFRDPINRKTHLSNFKNPLYPFVRLYKLIKANIEAERLLRQSKVK